MERKLLGPFIKELVKQFSLLSLNTQARYFSSNFVRNRVVITGLGVVCPIGVGLQDSWTTLLAKGSGIKPVKEEHKFGEVKSAAYIDEASLNLSERFSPTERRTLSKATLFTLIAATEALESSQLRSIPDELKPCVGVSIGQGMADLEYVAESLKRGKLSPHFVTRLLPNMAAGHVAIKFGLKGPNLCQATACSSGLHSIGDAFNLVRQNKATVMLAGGTEATCNAIGVEAFGRMRALSTKSVSDGPSRPFCKQRDGFVLGEGAGVLVLEELKHAQKRNARIFAEVLGFGASCDAHHITAPDTDGAVRSIEAALQDCEHDERENITYVNAHATSTPLGDENELKAVETALKLSKTVNISSNKGQIGHLLGASGAVESVFATMSVYEAKMPPNVNITEKMNTKLNILDDATKWNEQRRVVLKNSLGFGGTNASLLIANYEG